MSEVINMNRELTEEEMMEKFLAEESAAAVPKQEAVQEPVTKEPTKKAEQLEIKKLTIYDPNDYNKTYTLEITRGTLKAASKSKRIGLNLKRMDEMDLVEQMEFIDALMQTAFLKHHPDIAVNQSEVKRIFNAQNFGEYDAEEIIYGLMNNIVGGTQKAVSPLPQVLMD